MKKNKVMGRVSKERLQHFNCGKCTRWWSIGDASVNKKVWHCPWCGLKQEFKIMPLSKSK
ncbi:MAG: hypothetical protein AAB590_01840 [Patescibacteria group bacterium]